jgi:hypothetical protein
VIELLWEVIGNGQLCGVGLMKLSSNYLNKSYYVATMLQYNDELKREGFQTETKKKFLFDGEAFVADLYAQNDDEKRIYDFQLSGRKDSGNERTALLNALCETIGAKPIVIYVKPPVEKQIIFDELEPIINEYFLTGDLPAELSDLSDDTAVNAVKVDDILTASFEHSVISLSGCATVYATLQYGCEGSADGECRVCCESFPLSFDIWLDCDFNCKSLEYEIDLSAFESKKEAAREPMDNKNYMSKARFDTEFKLYQELSESVLSMTGDADMLFPQGFAPLPLGMEQRTAVLEERANNAGESLAAAGKAIKRYAPFMPKKLFEVLEHLEAECARQLYWYGEFVLTDRAKENDAEYDSCVKRTADIAALQTEFMDYLRKYLETLDVK